MVFPTQEEIRQAEQTQFEDSVTSRARRVNFGMDDVTVPVDNIYNSGLIFNLSTISDSIPEWSIYPARRDRAMRAFAKTEPMAIGAVYAMSSKLKALEWQLNGEENLQPDVQAMLETADLGAGYRQLIGKSVIDWCMQDNGFFWEKIGAGNPASELVGPVQGIVYLDPAQCFRTFDPEYPVMYIDPINGTRHKMHKTRVIARSSMTQPNELARGIGYCPVSRALLSVKTMKSIMQYRYEKASGSFTRGIIFGKGLTTKTLRSLIEGNDLDMEAAGLTRINNLPAYVTPTGVELDLLDLASLPDNWDTMNETQIYAYILALAFGIDVREIWAVTQSGATKGDATVQNMKARGKGLADLITTFEDIFNKEILPDGMTIQADFVDDEHDRGVADKNAVVVNTLNTAKSAGAITAIEMRALLIDENVLNPDTLENAKDLPGMAEFVTEFEQRQEDMQAQLQGNNPDDSADVESEKPSTFDSEEADVDSTEGKAIGIKWHYVSDIKTYTPLQRLDYRPIDSTGRYYGMKDKEGYGASLRAIARGYFGGEITFFDSVSAMDASIARHYTQAFREGFAEYGIKPDEISIEEKATLQGLITAEKQYVIKFFEWIASNKATLTYQAIFDRLQMWVNRYDMIKAKAMLLANGNQKLKWVIDPTKEHCEDCVKLDGRIYRAKIWDKYDIQPQSPRLACFGGFCGCSLVPTDEPVTKGRPPALKGHKHDHDAH